MLIRAVTDVLLCSWYREITKGQTEKNVKPIKKVYLEENGGKSFGKRLFYIEKLRTSTNTSLVHNAVVGFAWFILIKKR